VFTNVFTDVFTNVFADVFTDVFTNVLSDDFTDLSMNVLTDLSTNVFYRRCTFFVGEGLTDFVSSFTRPPFKQIETTQL